MLPAPAMQMRSKNGPTSTASTMHGAIVDIEPFISIPFTILF